MKKIMIILLSFAVIAAMMSIFSCGNNNPEQPAPTNTPTKTPTTVPSVGPTPIEFHFASDVEGWTVTCCETWHGEQGLNSLSYDATTGHTANGCLSASTNFTGSAPNVNGNIEYTFSSYMNLTGKTISVWIKVPQELINAGTFNAQIYIKNDDQVGCNWCYSSGGWTTLNSTNWIQISANVDSLTGSADKTQVKFIGVQVLSNNNPLTGANILFDDIVIQ